MQTLPVTLYARLSLFTLLNYRPLARFRNMDSGPLTALPPA